MPNGRIRKAVDKSINAAVSSGNLDLETHAAPISMLRFMADYLDTPNMETPAFRYVTPASFLSYCDRLGLAPDAIEIQPVEKHKEGSKGRMRKKFQSFDGGKTA